MRDAAYLELTQLTKSYPSPQGEAVIVKDLNFKFRKGAKTPGRRQRRRTLASLHLCVSPSAFSPSTTGPHAREPFQQHHQIREEHLQN